MFRNVQGLGEGSRWAGQTRLDRTGHDAVPPPGGHLVPHLPRHARRVPGGQRNDVGARHDAQARPLRRRLGVVDHVQHPKRQVGRRVLLSGRGAGDAVDENRPVTSLMTCI
jgi:hypothetical protein